MEKPYYEYYEFVRPESPESDPREKCESGYLNQKPHAGGGGAEQTQFLNLRPNFEKPE